MPTTRSYQMQKKYTKIICNKFNLNNPSVYAGMEIGEVGTRWKPKVKIF